ncbi:4'-phosphopantetheinyl transferase [Streptomyces sp. NPDC127098]|uniref:4'-phosphopantetheinyl transferase family protein n=1 Tax=Streptomyces sp. NPDC127098 TaxID=3347137 RepID=UPI00364BC7BB
MLEPILPPWVAVAEAFGDPPEAALLPAEEAVVARAATRRRLAFTTARHCARLAMGRLGLPPAAILPGARGAPGWPPGVTGSITHTTGYRAAALSREALAVGVDAEPHGPLPAGVLARIATAAEAAALRRLPPGTHWDRMLFSAKESVYKAWFPLTGRQLGFHQAEIFFEPDTRSFSVGFLVPAPEVGEAGAAGFRGRFAVGRGLLATAVAVPDGRTRHAVLTSAIRAR